MKLIKLILENFQGVKAAEYQFDGLSASIFGDNATGKTTVFNALTWLLFDKASTGAKNFSPKTKGPDGDLHYLDHSSEATFQLEDGRIVNLRKVFRENYKRKRGTATEEFDGHNIDYFIDGVPAKEKEYTEAMLSFCGGSIEKMKMLTSPNYFPEEMGWDARRKILLEICGDVSDEDVIAESKEIADLPTMLLIPGTTDQHYTVDEYKKIAAAKKAEINKQLQDIPGRIDEAERAKPDTAGVDVENVDAEIKRLEEKRESLESEKAQASRGETASSGIRKEIANLNAKLAEARSAHITNESQANEATNIAIGNLNREITAKQREIDDTKNTIVSVQRNIGQMQSRRNDLLDEYNKIQSEAWDESKGVCPTCGQELPSGNVEKLREEFNVRKSKRLEKINSDGKEVCIDKINAENDKLSLLKENETEQGTAIADLQAQHDALSGRIVKTTPFEQSEEFSRITSQIADLRAKESDEEKYIAEQTKGISDEIQSVKDAIREQQEIKGRFASVESQQQRINQLRATEKKLSGEYENIERGIFLCELFIKEKVGMLTDKINGKFSSVRFRLFQEQINGGIKEDCEVMIPSEGGRMVPYSFANNAARINAGLEIIDVLSKHWGLSIPVFVDNAESVTKLMQMDAQVIRLVVSEADKTLRLEI